MTSIQAQLERLFELEKQLNVLLDEEQYEVFLQQQDIFSDQIKYFLDNNSEDDMGNVIKQLKHLEGAVELLQTRSDSYYQQLKEKSLLMKRNKKKINAYK